MHPSSNHSPPRALPGDGQLLASARGAVLVSRTHATYCGLLSAEVASLEEVLSGRGSLSQLAPELLARLDEHGCFAAPRPSAVRPWRLRLQLTNECNLRCQYCCTSSSTARPAELSFDQWLAVIREARQFAPTPLHLGVLGGEPLLFPRFAELLEGLVAESAGVVLHTNGVLLREATLARPLARLTERGLTVRVSLAGPTAASCDELSLGARWDAALQGVAQLRAFGGTATVDLMLFPQTVESVATHLPALRRSLPPGTPIAFGLAYVAGREHGERVFASRRAIDAALETIAWGAGETIPTAPQASLTFRREGCHCDAGRELHLRSDGTVYRCFKMEEPVGRFPEESIAAIWGRVAVPSRHALDREPCNRCPLGTLCGGGCPSDHFLYTGSHDEVLCGEWRQQVLTELLWEDRPEALEWTGRQLHAEAAARGLPVPPLPGAASRHAPSRRELPLFRADA